MINILYLHGSADLYGSDVVLYELLKGLDKKLFKPYVILPLDGPLAEKLIALGVEVIIYPYPVIRRRYFNPKGVINYIFNYFTAVKFLKAFCKKKDIKIIHSNTIAVLEGLAFRKKSGIKHVWHLHEIVENPKIVKLFYTFLIRNLGRNVVAVSHAVGEHWMPAGKKYKAQVKVIHNSIDNNCFMPNLEVGYLRDEFGIRKDEMVVGMIGRINAIKGQSVFIEAMEEVIEKHPNTKAVMIGSAFEGQEWRLEALKRRIQESNFSTNFILRDFRKDIANIHCLFNILAFPSVQPEAFGLVVLESMASGKAVVSFKNGGVMEILEDGVNGLFANFGDPKSLAEKILLFIENEKLRTEIGRNNIEKQRKYFSIESFCANFNLYYHSIL